MQARTRRAIREQHVRVYASMDCGRMADGTGEFGMQGSSPSGGVAVLVRAEEQSTDGLLWPLTSEARFTFD